MVDEELVSGRNILLYFVCVFNMIINIAGVQGRRMILVKGNKTTTKCAMFVIKTFDGRIKIVMSVRNEGQSQFGVPCTCS